MCLRDAGTWHREQAGSSPYHAFRFCGEGSRSYVALMTKLSRAPSICQMSRQLSFFFSKPSQPSIFPAWPLRRLWHVALPPPVSWLLLRLAASSALMLLCATEKILGWVRTLPSHAVLVQPHLWSEAQTLHSEQLLMESTSFPLPPGGPLFEWLHPRIQLGSRRVLTLVHFNSSTSPVIGNSNLPCP